jgi:hypothetical protein
MINLALLIRQLQHSPPSLALIANWYTAPVTLYKVRLSIRGAEEPSSPYPHSLFSARVGVRLAVDVGVLVFGVAVGNPNTFPVLFVG